MALKTLFHRRVIGSADQSVDCWYLIIGDDCTASIQHTWQRSDGISEPKISSTTMNAAQFVETTRDVEVLGSLCAVLAERDRQAEGASDILTRASQRLH